MKKSILFYSFIALLFLGCNKDDEFSNEQLTDYMNLQPGKYIRYRLDSTIFINFGQKDTVISYQAKDVVDAAITDNLGRPGWRIIRYIRPLTSAMESAWRPTLTYQVTPTRESIEVIEDNLRYVKLKLPIKDGFNWLGNSFLPFSPFETLYPFTNDEDMLSWSYTYENTGSSSTVLNVEYDSTITVFQVDDSLNIPITDPAITAHKNTWTEKYARGIGLIYKEVLMWEYQPPTGSLSSYRHGFGIKLSIIDHN